MPPSRKTTESTVPWSSIDFPNNKSLVFIPKFPIPEHELSITRIVVILDVSGSMGEKIPAQGGGQVVQTQLDQAKHAVCTMIETLSPDMALSLITFSDSARVVIDDQVAENKTQLKNTVNHIRSGGGTNIGSALELLNLQNLNFPEQTVVFIITDGIFNKGLLDLQQCVDSLVYRCQHLPQFFCLGISSKYSLTQLLTLSNALNHYSGCYTPPIHIFNTAKLTDFLTGIKNYLRVRSPELTYRLMGLDEEGETCLQSETIDCGRPLTGQDFESAIKVSLTADFTSGPIYCQLICSNSQFNKQFAISVNIPAQQNNEVLYRYCQQNFGMLMLQIGDRFDEPALSRKLQALHQLCLARGEQFSSLAQEIQSALQQVAGISKLSNADLAHIMAFSVSNLNYSQQLLSASTFDPDDQTRRLNLNGASQSQDEDNDPMDSRLRLNRS